MQDGSIEGTGAGSVYVQTNEPDNHVIAVRARPETAHWSRAGVTPPAGRATASPT